MQVSAVQQIIIAAQESEELAPISTIKEALLALKVLDADEIDNLDEDFLRKIYNKVPRMSEQLLRAAKEGDEKWVENSILGAAVNWLDSKTGATALHYVAAYNCRQAFRVLLKSGKCDFLIRDNQGRLASELAGVYGHDPAMARLLLKKEVQQAKAQGIKLRRRERASA